VRIGTSIGTLHHIGEHVWIANRMIEQFGFMFSFIIANMP